MTPITSPPAASAPSATAPISPTLAPAVDEAEAALREQAAERICRGLGVLGPRAGARSAEDKDALDHRRQPRLRQYDGRIETCPGAPGASRPVSQRITLAPTSASAPS